MNSFNILDRHLNIRKHHLLEASAGTGKTFSIENIVVRLLIEEDPETKQSTLLEQILVMTFTRAAVRDLKIRIRSALEKSLNHLQGISNSPMPDYLLALAESEEETVQKAMRRLEQALASFDQAQIFTIHGFCARMLTHFVFESDFHIHAGSLEEKNLRKEEMLRLIRDFFRTEIHPEIYSSAQLQIVLDKHNHQIEKVQEALFKELNKDCDIFATAHFFSDLKNFNLIMRQLKDEYGFDPEKLKADFDMQMDCYKGINAKEITSIHHFFDLFNKTEWSSEDFDSLIREGLRVCELLAPDNLKKKKKMPEPTSLHYPLLIETLRQTLLPLIEKASSYSHIFARMAHDCRQLLQRYLSEEEKHRENDLLKHMLKAVDNPLFAAKARGLYQAAIIDEFQDTDPVQWEILSKLFLDHNKNCQIYLVGDPKQSIYAFRQADIYTYLSAANVLGKEHHASLDTNYRSQPSLVDGLNALFQACPKMFALPATDGFIHYPIVKSPSHKIDKVFSDSLGSIHFFCAEIQPSKSNQAFPAVKWEEEFYFPFMAQEIVRLHNHDKLKFNQFAALIKDKFQAKRLADFLDRYNIPYTLQRQDYLTDSIAWDSLKELLQGVLHPKNENFIKIALGSPILGWNYGEVKTLNDLDRLEQIVAKFYNLKRKLSEEGFGSFFQALLLSCWHEDGRTVTERLLQQEGGDIFLDELGQIASLLIEHQSEHPAGPDRLIEYLEECKSIPAEDEERLKKFADPARDAVAILTMHNSKGLEYDIVFAYGLIGRTKSQEQLIPQRNGSKQWLIPCPDKNSEAYIKYCEELDAEKMRQLYVAMTRAKYRLYVPVAITSKTNPGKGTVDFGCASPMDIFLARLGRDPCHYQDLYQRIEQEDGNSLHQFIAVHPELKISSSLVNHTSICLTKIEPENIPALEAPEYISIRAKQTFIQSFTSLSKLKKTDVENTVLDAPHDLHSVKKNPHTLPAGALTGKLLHKILETIPFSAVQKATSSTEITPWIHPFIAASEFQDWEDVFCEIIFQALKTPLESGFCVADVNPISLYRETEFLYPYENEIPVEDMQWNAGFLKGVIDLVFCHNDRYYLVDWKSNWLGSSYAHYNKENMMIAMQQHDYHFQAYIYQEALKRYLKLVDKRPFEEIYGGCFYIFLRGLNLSSANSTGILQL